MLAAWYIGALLVGALIGYTIGAIFRLVVPSGTNSRYWKSVGHSVHELIFGDDADFWSNYRRIIVGSGKYVVRHLLALALAFAPLVMLVFLIGPWIWSHWNDEASLIVYPEQAGTLIAGPSTPGYADAPVTALRLSSGIEVPLPNEFSSFVVCRSAGLACLTLESFGFTSTVSDDIEYLGRKTVVVRAYRGDRNPLWPYLNDPEFLFFLSLSLMSLYTILRPEKQKSDDDSGYGIGATDFALTRLAFGSIDTMYKLGNFETRAFNRRLRTITVTRPLFISGLARSGTTILLEKLASLQGIATHRYRDFPFMMAPIFWHGFSSLFGSSKTEIERPHKDEIKITRESPEAFEEPIWRFFFGQQLEPIHSNSVDPELLGRFEGFYKDHLKKILLVRKGTRYVSKGNYNILRIRCLIDLFPDARFLVPIRHPLTHVRSLARQHELFCGYAQRDPKVADYLRAAGHLEFGPQRMPLNVSKNGTERTLEYWKSGNQLAGYAQQWSDVYGAVCNDLLADPVVAQHIRLVFFENLCRNPQHELSSIIKFLDTSLQVDVVELARGIRMPTGKHDQYADDERQVWEICRQTAQQFGYQKDPLDFDKLATGSQE